MSSTRLRNDVSTAHLAFFAGGPGFNEAARRHTNCSAIAGRTCHVVTGLHQNLTPLTILTHGCGE
jgi:hypothetical protein